MTSTHHSRMTGDDLVTLVTEAPDHATALRIASEAPSAARHGAAELLYVDLYGLSRTDQAEAIVAEARA